VGPLGGDAGGPGVPTNYLKEVNGGSLGGDAGSPAAPTTNLGDVDGGTPGRRCRKHASAHHQS
jgi:hypothetical protein